MLDVEWIFGENADKRDTMYGDLMVIFDDAPREVLESEFVKTCIEKEWTVKRNKIYFWKVAFLIVYILFTNIYYSIYMFGRNDPSGYVENTYWWPR